MKVMTKLVLILSILFVVAPVYGADGVQEQRLVPYSKEFALEQAGGAGELFGMQHLGERVADAVPRSPSFLSKLLWFFRDGRRLDDSGNTWSKYRDAGLGDGGSRPATMPPLTVFDKIVRGKRRSGLRLHGDKARGKDSVSRDIGDWRDREYPSDSGAALLYYMYGDNGEFPVKDEKHSTPHQTVVKYITIPELLRGKGVHAGEASKVKEVAAQLYDRMQDDQMVRDRVERWGNRRFVDKPNQKIDLMTLECLADVAPTPIEKAQRRMGFDFFLALRQRLEKIAPVETIFLSTLVAFGRKIIRQQRKHWRFVKILENCDFCAREHGIETLLIEVADIVGDTRTEVCEAWCDLIKAAYKDARITSLRKLYSVSRGQGIFKRFVLPFILGNTVAFVKPSLRYVMLALRMLGFAPSKLNFNAAKIDPGVAGKMQKATDFILSKM